MPKPKLIAPIGDREGLQEFCNKGSPAEKNSVNMASLPGVPACIE